MARSRNIKPGFFRNELLVEMPYEYRLLFIGLWTIADREGRLQDRVKRIKMEVFPADSVDVEAGLVALAKAGFITRYCVNDNAYIAIPQWSKHQSPHHKEAESLIPAPGEPEASTGQAPGKPEASPSAAALIPDSGFLIPDSPPTEDAGASVVSDPDREWVWRDGPKVLGQLGQGNRQARSCLGRWLKEYTAEQVREAVNAALKSGTGDPVAYITKTLRSVADADQPVVAWK